MNEKKELKELCLRGSPDLRKVKHLTDMFPIRRKSILSETMRAWELVKDIPALGIQLWECSGECLHVHIM